MVAVKPAMRLVVGVFSVATLVTSYLGFLWGLNLFVLDLSSGCEDGYVPSKECVGTRERLVFRVPLVAIPFWFVVSVTLLLCISLLIHDFAMLSAFVANEAPSFSTDLGGLFAFRGLRFVVALVLTRGCLLCLPRERVDRIVTVVTYCLALGMPPLQFLCTLELCIRFVRFPVFYSGCMAALCFYLIGYYIIYFTMGLLVPFAFNATTVHTKHCTCVFSVDAALISSYVFLVVAVLIRGALSLKFMVLASRTNSFQSFFLLPQHIPVGVAKQSNVEDVTDSEAVFVTLNSRWGFPLGEENQRLCVAGEVMEIS
eukprot:TRINITY_DN8686_c0_g1_i1.p1 TRINITY_DN8686_c0_g1~~TRINITY_DN8686_c0_g1_i1.p1  ORF type:complete len:334 (+),score=-38.71 TRINITY_DN8686_c0_g1_i1:66-1004(+)